MNIRKITEQANQVSELNDINVTEAVSLKDMGFKRWDYIVPSFLIGRLEGVSPEQLTQLFGPSKRVSRDGKTTMEWGFQNRQGLIFTVYDYKNPPKSLSAKHNWSVGGVNKSHAAAVQRAFKMMGVPGKMIKEESDPFMVGQTVSEWREAGMEDLVETDVPLNKKFIMKGGRFEVRKAIDGNGYTIYLVGRHGSGLHVAGKTASLNKKDVLKALEDANKKAASAMMSSTRKEEVEVNESLPVPTAMGLKGKIRGIKVVKPVDFAKNLVVGKTYVLMYDTSYNGDPMYRLSASGQRLSGRISGKKIAKAIKDGMFVAEGVEAEGEDLQEGKIKFSRILQGIKDMQGPFTIVVMKPTGPGALMQKKVPGRDALPAHINHMLKTDLKDKMWKAIAIEGSNGGVLNVLFPKDVMKEGVEEETDVISESVAAVVGGALSTLLAGGFSFAALNFLFDNAFTPSSIKQEWNIFVRRWKDKSSGGKMSGDQGAAMAKEMRALIAKLPKKNQSYLSGIVTRMQNSLKPNKDGKVDKEAAGKFLRVAKERIAKTKVESVEMEEGFAQPTQKQLEKSIKWLEGLLKDPAKMKKSGLDLQDVKDNLRAAKGMISFMDDVKKAMQKPGMKEGVEIDEASWGGGFQSSREAQAGVQASAKADAKRERAVLFSSIRAVMMGKMSKAEFKKKVGQSFEKIPALAKQKAMKESVEEIDENTYTTDMGTKVTRIDYGKMAQDEAKKILAKAKELGVKVMVQSSTSVAFVKEFTKGNRDAYFKAYRECDTIRSMVKFTKRQNEWGCQGIGMLDCMEKGKIAIYKSGDGAAHLLNILAKSFRG